jgi:hypothetical protein
VVAVELALEAVPPSGRVSCEHIINVLARLHAPDRPQKAVTVLKLTQPPQANTARYDYLRQLQRQVQYT